MFLNLFLRLNFLWKFLCALNLFSIALFSISSPRNLESNFFFKYASEFSLFSLYYCNKKKLFSCQKLCYIYLLFQSNTLLIKPSWFSIIDFYQYCLILFFLLRRNTVYKRQQVNSFIFFFLVRALLIKLNMHFNNRPDIKLVSRLYKKFNQSSHQQSIVQSINIYQSYQQ